MKLRLYISLHSKVSHFVTIIAVSAVLFGHGVAYAQMKCTDLFDSYLVSAKHFSATDEGSIKVDKTLYFQSVDRFKLKLSESHNQIKKDDLKTVEERLAYFDVMQLNGKLDFKIDSNQDFNKYFQLISQLKFDQSLTKYKLTEFLITMHRKNNPISFTWKEWILKPHKIIQSKVKNYKEVIQYKFSELEQERLMMYLEKKSLFETITDLNLIKDRHVLEAIKQNYEQKIKPVVYNLTSAVIFQSTGFVVLVRPTNMSLNNLSPQFSKNKLFIDHTTQKIFQLIPIIVMGYNIQMGLQHVKNDYQDMKDDFQNVTVQQYIDYNIQQLQNIANTVHAAKDFSNIGQ